VLRRAFDRIMMGKVGLRLAAVPIRAEALSLQLDEVQRRLSLIREQQEKSLGERLALVERLVAVAEFGKEATESEDDLDAQMRSVEEQVRELAAESDSVSAEIDELRREPQRIADELRVAAVATNRRTRRVYQVGLAFSIVAIVFFVLFPGSSAKTARAVHLDYYSAVAEITPVLLIAGLVELAILDGIGAGAWAVFSFAVPAVSTAAAALDVLATHRSTPATLALTISGLPTTMILLVLYYVAHANEVTLPNHPLRE
jgi:hypothetical protein